MKYDVFKNAVSLICSYWNRKIPPENQLESWFPPINYIPGPAMEWIVDKINDQDRAPANIPRAIKTGWWDYLKEHPDKVQRRERVHCDECQGKGIIWARYCSQTLGHMYSYVSRCAKCENWKRHFGLKCQSPPLLTKADINRRGHQVIDLSPKGRVKPVNPVELARGIGRDIPNPNMVSRKSVDEQKTELRERGLL